VKSHYQSIGATGRLALDRRQGAALFDGALAHGRAKARAVRAKWGKGKAEPAPLRPLTPPVEPHFSLDFDRIGGHGACFLTAASSSYIRRNVETIEIKSAYFARRRLTVDLQLPTDPDIGEPVTDGKRIYWVPVTSILKHPPRSNIDLRDEQGRAVPLLTREENAAISVAALQVGARDVLGKEPAPLLADLLRELVVEGGIGADLPYVLARVGLLDAGADLDQGRGQALAESLRVLAGNSLVWVAIAAEPGARRVIKFHYDIELGRPSLRRQRPGKRKYLIYGEESKSIFRLEVPIVGDRNPYSPTRRLAARIALAVGLGAIDFGIESPYLTASSAYHLQVESPPGVETRDASVLANLPGAHIEPTRQSHGVHVYVTGAKIDVTKASLDDGNAPLVNIPLRASRRGFMTFSWLSAATTAALLWATAVADQVDSKEATAAVLLVGPALLAALVVRPGEHPVATKLLSGVRSLVALNGLLAVAAAAAVAGVRPGLNLDETWILYSIIASLVATVVTVGWVFSWDSAYRLSQYLRRLWLSERAYRLTCIGLILCAAAVLSFGSGLLGFRPAVSLWVYCGVLAVLIAPVSFVALSFARLALPDLAKPAWYSLLLFLIYGPPAAALLASHLLLEWRWETGWRILAALAALNFVLLAGQALCLSLSAADEGDDEASDRPSRNQ
jgi:hypothetical protein